MQFVNEILIKKHISNAYDDTRNMRISTRGEYEKEV
jgi:hypothetical protein